MVPLRLTLHNFLCYGDRCPEIDLSDIGIACLSGDNGHGKSALLDALTWALWGAARARTDDELVHTGQVDMEVQLEFKVGSVRYRVLRKRRKGTAAAPGRSVVELHVWSESVWKPLTGSTIRDTQQRITEAVRLDFETFRNSAFLMQGRADEFTLKAPGERKKILADILGLAAYDGYEARARESRRTWEGELRRLEAQAAQYAAELSREPAYERERQETDLELRDVEAAQGEKRAIVEALRETAKTVQLLRTQEQSARRELATAQERVDRDRVELMRQRGLIEARSALLARDEEIRFRAGELAAARDLESELSARLARASALQRTIDTASTEIERERVRIEAAIAQLQGELDRQEAVAAIAAGLAERRRALDEERRDLGLAELQLTSRREEIQDQSNTVGQLTAANKRLRDDMQELKRKQQELEAGEGSVCPVCRTELGEEGKRRAHETYEVEGKGLAEQYRRNQALSREAEAIAASLVASARVLEGELAPRSAALQRRLADFERDEREAAGAEEKLPALRTSLLDARGLLATGMYAVEARQRLSVSLAQHAGVGYDETVHRETRSKVGVLAGADSELTALLVAEEAVERANEAAARAEQDLAESNRTVDDVSAHLQALQVGLTELPDPVEPLQHADASLVELDIRDRNLRKALGAAEQRLDDCKRYRRLHDATQGQITQARLKHAIYDDLSTAFGRRGVQALIIDSVLPEIEEEANRLLARMTNGRMHVKLDTQRQAQKGTQIETLDISIADELGTRSYELFSGGEAFRINLALRIALSKLLARRAGAPLPTLIVDEGFGTQDAAGREKLIEAVNAVSRDFECLIVITHLDDLKDQFDRQIRVEKTATGSIARVI